MELKLRGLPVSGTKTDLIERLKPYHENSTFCSTSMEVSSTTTASISPTPQPSDTQTSTPPVSPNSSEIQNRDDTIMESQSEVRGPGVVRPIGAPAEQDRRLHEKERQIAELLKKLEHEQRLVEKLKMQLEVEKKCSVTTEGPDVTGQTSSPATVKAENVLAPNCKVTSNSSPLVKLEKSPTAPLPAAPLAQFIFSNQGVSQVLGQPQTLLTTRHPGTQILLPVSLSNNATAIQFTNTNGIGKLQVDGIPILYHSYVTYTHSRSLNIL